MSPLRGTVHPTTVGDVLIATAGARIVALHPLLEPLESALARLSVERDTTAVERTSAPADAAKRQLDEYLAGNRRSFSLPLDWDIVHGFTRTALLAVCDIPYGETAGYAEVAARAGSPRAARAVGTACATTPFSIVVPVHRVVRADGSLGGYGGHPEIKAQLLHLEETVIEQADRISATRGE